MLILVNANRMTPLVAPLGLEYVAGAARQAGVPTQIVDLALAADPDAALRTALSSVTPRLVGITFRNVDDSFWPSAQWFVPGLAETIRTIRSLTDAPIVLGGVGFSIFASKIIEFTGVEFGIRGDGEAAVVALYHELAASRPRLESVQGLAWNDRAQVRTNSPAWSRAVAPPTTRDMIDNAAYFRLGGQGAVETKRGCERRCLYCADPLARGARVRRRDPAAVADEFEALAAQGVDVLHLADGEFNLPADHAMAVCEELIRRRLGDRVRWYAYLAVVPFDAALAAAMKQAGCVGIDFTADSAAEAMLAMYRQPHRRQDVATAVRLCREQGIAVILDLLLGGPGETPDTVADTIGFVKSVGPDCAGAALGLRVYSGTPLADHLANMGVLETVPGIRRRYDGPVDFFRPTFYIAPALGERPASLVKDLVAGDPRFFEPVEDQPAGPAAGGGGYNYNDNTPLVQAIAAGERGAYWDILRRLRGAGK